MHVMSDLDGRSTLNQAPPSSSLALIALSAILRLSAGRQPAESDSAAGRRVAAEAPHEGHSSDPALDSHREAGGTACQRQ